MAETDKEQQTEEATPRKKAKLREEGNVAKSGDVGAAAVLFGVAATLAATGTSAAEDVLRLSSRFFRMQDAGRPLEALGATIPVLTSVVLPVLVVSAVLGTATTMVQTRGLFSLSLLALKPERLNPIPQLKNIFPTKRSLAELGKQLLKIILLGSVVYKVIVDRSAEFAMLAAASPRMGAATVGAIAVDVAVYGGAAFALIAALDYWLARRRFLEEAKMSKQDVRDEHKEQEGRPEVKMRRRQRMRELAHGRAAGDVKDATVLVCNPTHIAVALRYEPDEGGAPTVLAKGVDNVALRMRHEARGAGVPIIENRPLARSLNATAKIGDAIPVELYKAVAEVIAHVLRIRGRVPA
ncbi:MAG: EscU/YscU/HrcU family type III secretion system export apparatus switch protein [Myxococcota bacterium]